MATTIETEYGGKCVVYIKRSNSHQTLSSGIRQLLFNYEITLFILYLQSNVWLSYTSDLGGHWFGNNVLSHSTSHYL